jgi:hypothetical protein
MFRWKCFFSIVLVVWFAIGISPVAASPDDSSHTAHLSHALGSPVTENPYFWRLERDGIVSYGLGSNHWLSSKVLPLYVHEALAQSKVFAFERGDTPESQLGKPHDDFDIAYLGRSPIWRPRGDRLSKQIGMSAFRKLKALLPNVPSEKVDSFTLGMAISVAFTQYIFDYHEAGMEERRKLDTTGSEAARFLSLVNGAMDDELRDQAVLQGIPVEKLDSSLKFVEMFQPLGVGELYRILNFGPRLFKPDDSHSDQADFDRAYLAGTDNFVDGSARSKLDLAIDNRHSYWLTKIENLHRRGPAFIVAGAYHWIATANPLIKQLESIGFKVTRVSECAALLFSPVSVPREG